MIAVGTAVASPASIDQALALGEWIDRHMRRVADWMKELRCFEQRIDAVSSLAAVTR